MWSIILVVLIGTPFYIWSQLTGGAPDMGQLGVSALVFLLALGGAWTKLRAQRARDAQQAFWLRQGK